MIRVVVALLLVTSAASAQGVGRGATSNIGRAAVEDTSPFLPDSILSPVGGPSILTMNAVGAEVAALRLSVPLREAPHEWGAGRVLRNLALHRMEGLARPVGARVSASRTPWGLAYSVEGSAADFEYLAYILRAAVAEPDFVGADFYDALRQMQNEVDATLETPSGRLTVELRDRVAPDPSRGEGSAAVRLDGPRVRDVWLRSHQLSTMRLVTFAPVAPEVVLAAVRGMGAPNTALQSVASTEPGPASRRDPESVRVWLGQAFSAEPGDPRAPVAGQLLGRHLTGSGEGFDIRVELWELPDRWVLALIGSADPESASDLRATMDGVIPQTVEELDPAEMASANASVRRDLLWRSRTPGGLVEIVGHAADATDDPLAAARAAADLDTMQMDDVAAFLSGLATTGPTRVEVR